MPDHQIHTILYSGHLENGTLAKEIPDVITTRSDRFHSIANSEVGRLLENQNFQLKLRSLIASEQFNTTIANATDFQKSAIQDSMNKILYGIDSSGKRIDTASLWDIASEKYVSEAKGNFRIIAGGLCWHKSNDARVPPSPRRS